MDIKKLLQVFLGSWAILLFLIVLTGVEELNVAGQIIATGVLAALITLLAMVATRGEKNKKNYSVCAPGSDEVICRVEGEWIFKGTEEKASWYIKRGAVYGFQNMKPLYRLKGDQVTREGESEPCLRVEAGKVVDCANGQVLYEIK